MLDIIIGGHKFRVSGHALGHLDTLVLTLKELAELGIGFVSLTEAFDMTAPTGRAMAGMLAVFAEFERENTPRARQSRHRTSPLQRNDFRQAKVRSKEDRGGPTPLQKRETLRRSSGAPPIAKFTR
jgi:DNA invertase Pin-like site-specific DNA recombinase